MKGFHSKCVPLQDFEKYLAWRGLRRRSSFHVPNKSDPYTSCRVIALFIARTVDYSSCPEKPVGGKIDKRLREAETTTLSDNVAGDIIAYHVSNSLMARA